MPADSIHVKLIAAELNEALSGGRIDKITMPDPDEIVLHVHRKANYSLVLSANTSLPRVHITSNPPKNNPLVAPSFLMHLRKHISGAIINRVFCRDGERIIILELATRNELGYEEKKALICEVMGKYANVILVNSDGKISEAIKHISPAGSELRPILPGLKYSYPPAQNKISIFDSQALKTLLNGFEGGKLDGYILAGAAGLAPVTITAVISNVLGGVYFDKLDDKKTELLVNAFNADYIINNAKPCLSHSDGKTDFWIYPFYGDVGYEFKKSLNEAMDAHFGALDRDRRLAERARIPKTAVKNAIARTEKKLKLFTARLSEAADAEHDRLCGELIIANIYRLKQGLTEFTADNYYVDPPETITVPLDKSKSPQYNAQAYFKKYNKKKKSIEILTKQIAAAESDLEYFNSIFDSFAYTDFEGLDEITAELYAAGIMHEPKNRKKDKPQNGGDTVIGGCRVRFGKNNYQNDRLTKQAHPEDIWLHTQKTHGSHVIISGNNVPMSVILRAAQIAAYYSKARLSDNVAVDYTFKKYVSKPKGSAPGKVIYTNYKTVFVTPKEE